MMPLYGMFKIVEKRLYNIIEGSCVLSPSDVNPGREV